VRRGFTVIELLIAVAIIGLLAATIVPMVASAMLRARVNAVSAESKLVYTAFRQHFVDLEEYPNASSSPNFELGTFEPLVALGYYDGSILSQLANGQADGYDSPDDQRNNREFWVEMTLEADPSVRFLVADSDNAPLGGGTYRNGIYLYRDGALTPIHEFR